LIGLRLAAEHPERFARIVVANSGLPTGDQPLSDAFFSWQRFSQETADFPVGAIVSGGCTSKLSPEVIAAYDAPFPGDEYKAGARIFPLLVPTGADDPAAAANRQAWGCWLVGRSRCLPHSLMATRSRLAVRGSSSAPCREPRASRIPSLPAGATSSRRTKGPSSPRWWPAGWHLLDHLGPRGRW
jgi:pimeloyl-ACP methyl ester carboxylesterase